MPERTPDNHGIWKYDLKYPGADLKQNQSAVEAPYLVEAVGWDGRFIGSLRPFPGMADKTIHGVPVPAVGETTITAINNIQFVKYAAIRKGTSGETLKGLVYFADNQAGTGKALYFAYMDSTAGAFDVIMLEDFSSWFDFWPTSFDDYDISYLRRYIYFVNSGSSDTEAGGTIYDAQEPAYNKAYYWDFKINTWDTFVTGFAQRFLGIAQQRVVRTAINEDVTIGTLDSDNAFDTEVIGSSSPVLPAGNYTFAGELISKKHNLRSFLRLRTETALGTPLSSLRWKLQRLLPVAPQAGNPQQLRNAVSYATSQMDWGLQHWDGLRIWRSPVDDLGLDPGKYGPLPLYLVDEYIERLNPASADFTIRHDLAGTGMGTADADRYLQDAALMAQTLYDPILQEFGPAPRMKRIAAYDGLLVGVMSTEEPAVPTKNWSVNQTFNDAIVWSATDTNESENFKAANVYPIDDPSEHIFALELAGDFLFAVSNAGIYKIARAGSQIVVNRLQYRLGGMSRFGQTAIGNTLYVVTKVGIREVDGNSGEIRNVSALDRVILDDREWASTLPYVHLEYDAQAGCLVFLNTALHEMVLFWESTGAITTLENVPWVFLAGGSDLPTDGPQRCFFVTSTGGVHCIDSSRQMGKRTMYGAAVGDRVNGTVTSISATHLIDSVGTFSANCVGFSAYILSGLRAGETLAITARNSGTDLTVSGLSGALAVGDRYSIAPIISRATLPQLLTPDGADFFVTKITSALALAASNLSGEVALTDPNAMVTMGVKKDGTSLASSEVRLSTTPNRTVVRVNYRANRLHPFIEFKGANLDFELQALQVKGELGLSEAEVRQG